MKASRMKLENVNVTAFKKLNIRKANFDLTTVAENFVNLKEADKALLPVVDHLELASLQHAMKQQHLT